MGGNGTTNSIINKIYYLKKEKEEGRKKEGEKDQCVIASPVPPTGDLAGNPRMCQDWESIQQPFGSQASTQSSEPNQPGQEHQFLNCSGRYAT